MRAKATAWKVAGFIGWLALAWMTTVLVWMIWRGVFG